MFYKEPKKFPYRAFVTPSRNQIKKCKKRTTIIVSPLADKMKKHTFATHLTVTPVNVKVKVLRILGCIIKTSVMDE